VDLNLSNHFETIEVESEVEMMEIVDRINNSDLSNYDTQPLWKFYRISNKNGDDLI
jgi:hypothetical protein